MYNITVYDSFYFFNVIINRPPSNVSLSVCGGGAKAFSEGNYDMCGIMETRKYARPTYFYGFIKMPPFFLRKSQLFVNKEREKTFFR